MIKIDSYIPDDDSIYQNFYSMAKDIYVQNAKELIGEDVSNRDIFSWLAHDLTLHFVHRTSPYSSNKVIPVIFATSYLGSDIKKYDATKITNNFRIKQIRDDKEFLSYLFWEGFFDFEPNLIIESSIYSPITWATPQKFSDRFVEKEYLSATAELKQRPIELINFNELRIHKDLYDFETMLKAIDDKQFEAELLECIKAYNNQLFFVAAAGLGSVLEHLLYKILEKHNMIDNKFPKDPTRTDYLNYLRREPIQIDVRSEKYINSLFILRNSISHYNKGFTSKSACTQMMQGIKDIFDNYYL